MKNIFRNIKWSFIPDIIKEDFIKLASDIDTKVCYDENINEIQEIDERELENVFFEYITDDVIFLMRKRYYDNLNVHLNNGLCRDLSLRAIGEGQIKPFLIQYGHGFMRGYNEYETTLKKSNPLFSISEDSIKHKVYSRIKECKLPIPLFRSTFDVDALPQDESLFYKEDKTVRYVLENETLFLSGIEDGEFYKAWEIILENPLLFEPIFNHKLTIDTHKLEFESSNFEKTNCVDKVALLYELGIIDYLANKDNKKHSVNSIAKLLSQITDMKIGTIFPAINPLINTESRSNGKPSVKALKIAREKIINSNY